MEDAYIISGGKPLSGEVKLSGAKNVALKVVIAALMFEDKVVLHNIPRINDIFELLNLINSLGGKAEFIDKNSLTVDSKELSKNKVDFLYGSKIRVSFMMFAPLLHKFKTCYVPNPGGCRIGARPIDRIIEGMRRLGVKVEYDSKTGYYKAEANGSFSNSYTFPKTSHTGTELLILISVLGKKTVTINNAALEPEIDDLVDFLNQSGAKIKRAGSKIVINPIRKLKQKQPYTIISDRNEAVTYASLALATKGRITITKIHQFLIDTFIKKIKEAGGGIDQVGHEDYKVSYKNQLKAVSIETLPYPGFMTDWQPNWAVLMTQAKGVTTINERVFENRFSYVDELRKLGAEIDYIKIPVTNQSEYFFFNFDPAKKYRQAVRIVGPQRLHGGVLTVADLRAGASLAIAALVAEGESIVNGASILERGYEDFVKKIQELGGNIKKI